MLLGWCVWNRPSQSNTRLFTGELTISLCFVPQHLFLCHENIIKSSTFTQSWLVRVQQQLSVSSKLSHSHRNHCSPGSHCSVSHGCSTSFSMSTSPAGNRHWRIDPDAHGASWRCCLHSQIWRFPGHVLEVVILVLCFQTESSKDQIFAS